MDNVAKLDPIQQAAAPRRESSFLQTWRRNTTLAVNISLVVLIALILAVVFAEQITPIDPVSQSLMNRLSPPFGLNETGSWEFPLGTDALGRDVFSRILYGGRISLAIGGVATLLGLALGTVLGLLGGYIGGWLDQFVMYLVDVQLSLPFLLLAVAVALVLGTSLTVLVGLAALATWPIYTRIVRAAVLSVRERDYVIAAQAAGAGGFHIMVTHLFPSLVAPLLVLATLSVGRIILLEAGLSFLGIGIQPPTPSWGNMINEGRDYLASAWWLATMPGIALALLTMAVGTIGDWLRDLADVTVS
ncbi:MAG: ABC transporter permease [Chloroflexi bacterium]|nr:ABC transporter permease [Chloroflexota bacterium]